MIYYKELSKLLGKDIKAYTEMLCDENHKCNADEITCSTCKYKKICDRIVKILQLYEEKSDE